LDYSLYPITATAGCTIYDEAISITIEQAEVVFARSNNNCLKCEEEEVLGSIDCSDKRRATANNSLQNIFIAPTAMPISLNLRLRFQTLRELCGCVLVVGRLGGQHQLLFSPSVIHFQFSNSSSAQFVERPIRVPSPTNINQSLFPSINISAVINPSNIYARHALKLHRHSCFLVDVNNNSSIPPIAPDGPADSTSLPSRIALVARLFLLGDVVE